eukprot:7423152-Ditylum_brightwellii.AAC.1
MELRSIKTANDCLAPDYDVHAQIEETYKSLRTTFQTNHVKGHQDRDEKTEKEKQKRTGQ